MKKPFIFALAAALYVVVIVLVVFVVTSALKAHNDTIIIPMAMLSLFVLSAAVMGFLFLSEPLSLLVANKKKEAVVFFAKITGVFAVFVAIFATLLFLVGSTRPTNMSVNINFDETGHFVKDNPGLKPGVWYLVYEKPGAPALTAELMFNDKSICIWGGKSGPCPEVFLPRSSLTRVRGVMTDSGAVRVIEAD